MLAAGEDLALKCSAMGSPHPQVDWYKDDSRIIVSSRTQINENEIDAATLDSMLVISSVTEADSGTYECRVVKDSVTASIQYKVVVGACVHVGAVEGTMPLVLLLPVLISTALLSLV